MDVVDGRQLLSSRKLSMHTLRESLLKQNSSCKSPSLLDTTCTRISTYHQDYWWLAQVLAKDSEVELSLLLNHPYGPSRSFKHPPSPNVITLAVLTIVEPRTTTGCIYTLTQRQSKAATDTLKRVLSQ